MPRPVFDSTDKAPQRQTLALYSDVGRPPINPALTGTKSVPALFSNRPDVRRGWFIRRPGAILAEGARPAREDKGWRGKWILTISTQNGSSLCSAGQAFSGAGS
ncbi:hypothetical protein BQ8482_111590 [Mesorhizobium delmotii]|uniref:Uncharacterized protein n=1 Tax=Mesorhizobium delmotii TaxID=1631247 RepID=A0A2P9AEV2_9HYPH|nr:hypothetical protein BQ8482_111590 [Mesorhizobium delmotii]